jgi:hypothetical protein
MPLPATAVLVAEPLEDAQLVHQRAVAVADTAQLCHAWRTERGGSAGLGRALQLWLQQLDSPVTRRALIERHAGPLA